MNELSKMIDEKDGIQTVNARELHGFLESKQDFSTWIKNRIEKFNFEENVDYTLFHKKMEQVSGAKYLNEYYISIDMAKELSMVENNDKGKQARKYFIEIENKYKLGTKVLSSIETMFISFMQQQSETNKLLLSLIQNNKNQIQELPQHNKVSVTEFFKKNKIQSFNIKNLAIVTGKQATRLSKDLNRNIQYKQNEESGFNEGYYDEDLMETALMVAKKLIEKNNTLFKIEA